ncbi:MAG: hypothetical protein QMD53_06680 [Actinomycetota bacterium]|nr:hypothetical protein [Actinomycetota bacterium]
MYSVVAEESDAMLKASLAAIQSMAEQSGQDFEDLKEETVRDFAKHKEWAKGQADEALQKAEEILETDFSAARAIPTNQETEYQGVKLNIASVKRDSKSKGTDLLTIQIEAKNEAGKEVFIFWNEEARLISVEGEVFSVDDYDLETSFADQTTAKGHLFIPVKGDGDKFILQLGKKSLPKIEVELDLSKNLS